jgi:hypothetical protein
MSADQDGAASNLFHRGAIQVICRERPVGPCPINAIIQSGRGVERFRYD